MKQPRSHSTIILDRLTGSDPSVKDDVLEVPARCLQCGAEINEKTLVALREIACIGQRAADF